MKKGQFKFDHLLIINLFNKYGNATKVAKEVGCTVGTICNVLEENNIKRDPGKVRRIPLNENFFEIINTEESAYWLGFLYADGAIINYKNNLTMKVALDSKDHLHLEKFKESLKWKGSVKLYNRSLNDKKLLNKTSTIAIGSSKLCNDLIDKGCTLRKTLTIKFPTINQVPNDLIHHFIRGYFDGDGSVFLSNEKHWRNNKISSIIHCRFIGTKELMEKIAEILQLPNILVKHYKKCINKNVYTLNIKRVPRSFELYKYLYKDASIYLNRKKEIFDKYFNT